MRNLQVVTGADDATISVWDLTNGQKSLSFCGAGQIDQPAEEITSMTFDHSLRKLIVGNRDGNVDVGTLLSKANKSTIYLISDI